MTLHEILKLTTIPLRKGDVVETTTGPLNTTTINLFPHESEARDHLEKVDLILLTIGVDKAMAGRLKPLLMPILKTFPWLNNGPSYISAGAELGDQTTALQLFALGKILGLWNIITPADFKLSNTPALELAQRGAIWITGYQQ